MLIFWLLNYDYDYYYYYCNNDIMTAVIISSFSLFNAVEDFHFFLNKSEFIFFGWANYRNEIN